MTDKTKQGQFLAAVETVFPEFDPLIFVAWAAHETRKFEKVIGLNNFFGMKVPKDPGRRALIDAEPVRVPTAEIIGYDRPNQLASLLNRNAGNIIKVIWQAKRKRWVVKLYALFADWSRELKALEYIRQYLTDLFPDALDEHHDPYGFACALVDGPRKYATDPEYKHSFMAMYRTVKREVVG